MAIGRLLLSIVLLAIGLLLVVARLLTIWLLLVGLFLAVVVGRSLDFADRMVDVALIRSWLCIAGLSWLRLIQVSRGS